MTATFVQSLAKPASPGAQHTLSDPALAYPANDINRCIIKQPPESLKSVRNSNGTNPVLPKSATIRCICHKP